MESMHFFKERKAFIFNQILICLKKKNLLQKVKQQFLTRV